jgi:hypothetical protein
VDGCRNRCIGFIAQFGDEVYEKLTAPLPMEVISPSASEVESAHRDDVGQQDAVSGSREAVVNDDNQFNPVISALLLLTKAEFKFGTA